MARITVDKTFDTQKAAEEFRDSYLREYHPAGYGTTLSITKQDNGKFRVTGYRWSTCD
jgi:hypothetical protein